MSLNKSIIQGNITKDLEGRFTSGNNVFMCNFTVAVNETYKGEKKTSFINCVAFSKTAEFLTKYFAKGDAIIVEGKLQTRIWEKEDGTKVYITEIIAEQLHFAGGKKKDHGDAHEPQDNVSTGNDDFFTVVNDDELPF